MKKIDLIMQCIENELTVADFTEAIKQNLNPGMTASSIQDKLGIVRNNASTLLNQLWKEHQLIKINSRPVSFFPTLFMQHLSDGATGKDTYSIEELYQLIHHAEPNSTPDPFAKLLGNNSSLVNQIGQAKAAIVYPPKGLHTLILGESGVGKTTFACAMHEYGMQIRQKTKEDYPFITFNCADYFNNPQLLLSQLFGHAKNAFTGADKDKVGLVEKADGGILFLDEIHRLPPDGQEMLFYLIDKGEYNRLGEIGTKRTSNVLIIAATTEEPSDTLLATFIRRIPVNITLPSFHEKPISEKIEIVDHFFYCEALNLNRKIILSPEVLKSLAIYDFRIGNIGQLRSEIKLLCAKAFLQHLQNQKEILIDFQMLNREIREGLFDYAKLDSNIQNYLNMFSENILIFPVKERESFTFDVKNNIYEIILQKLDALKKSGLNNELIHAELSDEVETHFKQVMDKFTNTRASIQNLYKIVPKQIVDTAALVIETAQQELKTKFHHKFIFGLAFHLQALLKRIEEQKIIFNPHLQKIKQSYPAEYRTAQLLVKQLMQTFSIKIPEDESGFLALLLTHNKIESPQDEKIGLIIVCHGESTASSIANVVNALLNTEWVKAIDMPLSATISETYHKVRSAVVGNTNPNLDVPYFPIHQLLEPTFQKKFLQVLTGGMELALTTPAAPVSIYDKSQALLEQYVKYINPKFALKHIKKFLEQIHYKAKSDSDAIDFIVHMGCMLDRCRHQYLVQFDDRNAFIQAHKQEFEPVRFAVDLLAKEYEMTINDDEVCYIIKILQR